MRELFLATFIFLIVVVGAFVFISWNTWLAKLDQGRMARDIAFKTWLDRVDARLEQYGAKHVERDLADWKIDFESGVAPDLAAKNLVRAGRPD